MITELDKLEEWFVEGLNAYEASGKYGASELKRIKRFGNEVINNIEMYGELLDAAKSEGLSIKEILSPVRRIEANLLDEASKGTKTSRKQMISDVIHHIYAQRTGGDTLRNLPQLDRKAAREALRQEFGRWGNVPENLYSLFRSWHTKQEKAKGLEQRALDELGYKGKAGDIPTIKAHQTASSSPLISGTIPGATTAQDAIKGMRPQFELQRKETMAALEQSNPLMNELDRIAGSTYDPGMPAEELAIRRNVLDANADEVAEAVKRNLQPYLQLDNGSIKVARNLNRFGKLLPYAGLVTGGILAGSQAMAGDLEGAKGTLFETAVGEIPIAGDILSSEPAATGTLDAPNDPRLKEPKSPVAKLLDDPMNELKWLGKKLTMFGGGIRLGW